jgi:adenine-specific DNA-methyltransferase
LIDLGLTYSRELLTEILESVLPEDLELLREPKDIRISSRYKRVTKAHILAEVPSLDLTVFELHHSSSSDPRIEVAKDAFRIMAETFNHRSIIALKNHKSDQWRLSLMTIDLASDSMGRAKQIYSSPKRHSYILGPKAKVATPGRHLIKQSTVKTFQELQTRFAPEVVNNEFYGGIAKLYDQLVGAGEINKIIKYPGSDEESREFVVRLIGRIIFCWFLREKKSSNDIPLVPSDLLSRDAVNTKNYYHKVLAPLFFEVLNKDPERRSAKFRKNGFQQIPYLNGGLFSDDDVDYYKFDNALEISTPGLVDVPDTWLQELFDLLELYNFTVDENTSYDIDLSIDPEMLGRVFENLLARINPETGETVRRMTGSFYTPREIVEYMVDVSLVEYLKSKTVIESDKLEALVSCSLSDDLGNKLNKQEGEEVLDSLSMLTVLDPACGSGAFPIGMLQKIVSIISILDPDAKRWLSKQLGSASPELKRELESKGLDYIRKLGVIRQTIFGIDIQPIATEITRLRCFLTLIVDEDIDDNAWNRGIRPLPNLDFKFVTANTLIPLPKPADKKGGVTENQTNLLEETSHIEELKRLRSEYFISINHERSELQAKFSDLQRKMFIKNIDEFGGSASSQYEALSRWEPFSHNASSWFDPEWMFGISDGFDIVIGNPPYVRVDNIDRDQKKVYKNIYNTTRGKYDMYYLFYELALRLAKKAGVVTYISPNKFCAADSALTLRNLLLDGNDLKIVSTTRLKVFDRVSNYPIIAICQKASTKKKLIFREAKSIFALGETTQNSYKLEQDLLNVLPAKIFPINCTQDEIELLLKLVKAHAALGELIEFSEGLRISSSKEREGPSDYHIVKQYQFSRWSSIKQGSHISKTDLLSIVSEASPRYKKMIKNKIIIAEDALQISATIDENKAVPQGGVYFGSAEDNFAMLGILNSNLLSRLYKILFGGMHMGGGYLRYRKNFLELLPVPLRATNDEVLRVVSKEIIEANKAGSSSDDLIQKLNERVFELYELTSKEVKLINGE